MIGRMMIVGASRGIGAAMAAHYAPQVEHLLTVSRTPAAVGDWHACDVTDASAVARLAAEIGHEPLDALLYLGGTWERGAFTDVYRFEASPPEEIREVVAVNLVAPILLAQALLPQIRRSGNPRIVLIGALGALNHAASPEVANSASKFGLRGVAQALQLALGGEGVAVTIVNPGNVATAEVEDDIATGRFDAQTPIPLADLARVLDCVLAMSPASVVSEVNLAQRRTD